MKKFKNLALIVTLILPLLVATIQPIYATTKNNRPTETEVIIHSVANYATKENMNKHIYWGNGTEADFWESMEEYDAENNRISDWRPQEGKTFYAFKLPDYVVKQGTKATDFKPIISDEVVGHLDADVSPTGKDIDIKWSDIYGTHKVDTYYGGTYTEGDNLEETDNAKISPWTLEYNYALGELPVESFIALNELVRDKVLAYWLERGVITDENDEAQKVVKYSEPTDSNGTTKFILDNGTWVIKQAITSYKDPAMESTFAVPMIIQLPMMNPVSDKASDYYYDATGNNSLHLFAKQYDPATIKVTKTDAETAKKIKGAQFLAVRQDAVNIDELYANVQKIITDLKDNPTKADDIVKKYLGSTKFLTSTTDATGIATFSSDDDPVSIMNAGASYFIAEIYVPAPYLVDPVFDGTNQYPGIHAVEISEEVDPEDKTIIIGAGETSFEDYDAPTVDKAVTVNGKTYGLNEPNTGDNSQGVARGQIFQWVINSTLNRNVGSYSQYDLLDTIPYNSNWTDAKLALTYTDKNGKTQSISLFEMMQNLYPRNALGVAELEHDSGEGIGYTSNEAGSTVNGNAIAYDAATAPTVTKTNADLPATANIELAGKTSVYTFDAASRTVDQSKAVEDGYALLSLNADLRTWLQEKMEDLLADGAKDGSWKLNWTMDAFANTAAQSGDIVNNVELLWASTFTKGTAKDKTHTFTAGWEIVKTDGTPTLKNNLITNGLAGAGFNLAYQVTSANISTILNALYSSAAYPSYKGTASAADIAQLKSDVAAGKTRYVYFMHADATTEMPMPMMDSDANSPMGDVVWTLAEANATTHISGSDGYLQYCGLAGGNYQLIEKSAPTGYKLLEKPYEFTLTRTDKGIINGQAGEGDIFVANYKLGDPNDPFGGILPKTGWVGLIGLMIVGLIMFFMLNAGKLRAKFGRND
ncbi:MAG: prealbumin-like fold domain-containing protein [Lactobacillaceae bacterium]|jgi:hypothetical protein|nr:prealbumin-like fold domain-containing protein [Lactobacillaceae bacterium]